MRGENEFTHTTLVALLQITHHIMSVCICAFSPPVSQSHAFASACVCVCVCVCVFTHVCMMQCLEASEYISRCVQSGASL